MVRKPIEKTDCGEQNRPEKSCPTYSDAEIEQLKKETYRSQRQAENLISSTDTRDADFQSKGSYSETKLRHCVTNLKEDAINKNVRCHKEQKDIIARVVNQVIEDANFLHNIFIT